MFYVPGAASAPHRDLCSLVSWAQMHKIHTLGYTNQWQAEMMPKVPVQDFDSEFLHSPGKVILCMYESVYVVSDSPWPKLSQESL